MAIDWLSYYRARLPGLKKDGGEWRAACRLHGGTRPDSLSVDPETGRWHCHADCQEGGDAYGFEMKLRGVKFPEAKRVVNAELGIADERPTSGGIVATYDYRDERGELVYQVVRKEPKKFLQRQPDPSQPDGWSWKVRGLERLLYRLPEVVTSAGRVYVAEGEKDVDALRGLGLVATCNSGGAGKFTQAMAKHLAGREVVILPDRDPEGRKHADQVAAYCRLEGATVLVVELPGAGKDPADWVAAGGTREALERWIEAVGNSAPPTFAERGENPAQGAPGLPVSVSDMLANYVILFGTTDVFCRRTWKFMGREMVRHAHEATYAAWAKDPEVQKIDASRVVFKPQGAAPGDLNLFRGLPLVPDPGKPCGRIRDHVAFLCGGDADHLGWVERWLAYPLQHPGAKMHTALVMYGVQGSGKSILFEQIMALIYGSYHLVIGQFELSSRFTGWASQKLFVACSEVEADRRHRAMSSRLKQMITGATIGIEEKNVAFRSEENHMNLVFMSNAREPVEVEEDDRRFMVVRCERKQDPAYYQALGAEIAAGGATGYLHHLMTLDLGDFGPHTLPLATEHKAQLVLDSAASWQRFLHDWAAGDLPVPFATAATSDVYEAYRVWCHERGERNEIVSSRTFCVELARRYPTARKEIAHNHKPSLVNITGLEHPADAAKAFKRMLDAWLERTQRRRLA